MPDDDIDSVHIEQQDWCLNSDDLRSIVSCCPSLRELNVHGTVKEGADVSALQLPACCKSLSIGGVGFGDSAAPVIVQLSQLTQLTWRHSPDLTFTGLKQVCGLKRLRKLCISEGCDVTRRHKIEWSDTEQLDDTSAGSADSQAEIGVLRQQLADSQAQHKAESEALRQQLADARACVARLQQQLAAAGRSGGGGGQQVEQH